MIAPRRPVESSVNAKDHCQGQGQGLTLLSETRGIVLPDAENRMIVSSFVWTQYRNVTDGRTDEIPIASTALCIASNADAL